MWRHPRNFFDLNKIKDQPGGLIFQNVSQVWEVLDLIKPFIQKHIKPNVKALRRKGDLVLKTVALVGDEIYDDIEYELGDPYKKKLKISRKGQMLPEAALIMAGTILAGDQIEIGAGALIESGAMIKGPAMIGPYSEVRQGAYIREEVLTSPGAVVGHATEAKNSILLEGAKAGHFAYLGDSVLGLEVNLGAGTKLANLKMNNKPFKFRVADEIFQIERRKFGAIIGDHSETGCNSVTNPGVILGQRVKVLPNVSVRSGYCPNDRLITNSIHE